MATKKQLDDVLYSSGGNSGMLNAYDVAIGRGDAFSEENPYYRQMQYAKNRTDLERMRSAAIEWESNQQNYQQQLADQRALRDEERAYNTPAAQAARMRAAGINPDIGDGSGISASSGSGTSSSAPNMAPTDMDTLTTPMETSQTVFQGIQSAASLISSVGGFVTSSMQFAKDAASFGSFLTLQDSAVSISQSQADRSAMATADMKFNQMAGIATSLPEGMDVNDDKALSSHLSALGYDDTYMPGVRAIQKSPELQKRYNDSLVAAREAREINTQATDEYVRRSISASFETQALQRGVALAKANFDQSFANEAYTAEEGAIVGQAEKLGNREKLTSADIRYDKTQRAYSAYVKSIAALGNKVKELNERIAEEKEKISGYELSPGKPRASDAKAWAQSRASVRSMENQVLELYLVGSEQCSDLVTTLQNISYKQSVNDEARPGSSSLQPGWTWTNSTDLNYYDLMFNKFVENSGQTSDKAQSVLQQVLTLGSKVITK